MTFDEMCQMAARNNREKGLRSDADVPTFLGLTMRLCGLHGKVSEAYEIVKRRGNRDEGEPALEGALTKFDFGHELADIVIRTMDIADLQGIDLGKAIIEKLHLNATRPQKYGTSKEGL